MGQRKANKNVDPRRSLPIALRVEEQRQVTGPLQNTAGAEKFPVAALQRPIWKARGGFPCERIAPPRRSCANKIQSAMAHA